jgi:hypothetical protein
VSGPPTVVIAANPYEAELCRRALSETGLKIEIAEGGDGLLEMVAEQKPLAVVIADGLFCGDMQDLLREVREKHPQTPVFLVGERGGDVPDEAAATWLGARRLFFRPIEVEAFADAVEKIAVEAELASEVSEQLEAVHAEDPPEEEVAMEAEFEEEKPSLGRLRLKPQPRFEAAVELPVRRAQTEVILPANGKELNPPPASIVVPEAIPSSSSAEGIMRVDEAMADEMMVTDLVVRENPPTQNAGGVAELSPFSEPRFARRLDRELSAAERRLFPDSPGMMSRAPIYDDYDDALGDIDLDSLGIDTMPGISAEALDALERRPEPRSIDAAGSTSPGQKVTAPRETPSGLHQLASQRDFPSADSTAPDGPQPIEEEGSLQNRDLAELLATLHASGWSGRCVLQRGDGEKAIYFDNGMPVFGTSTLVNDRLGDLLYREGKISREQHARTRELTVEPGRRTAVLFVELGLIKSAELFPTLRRHVEEIIYSSFAWDHATYRLEREQASPEDKLRLSAHPWALFLEGIRRKYGLERLVDLVGPPETVLAPTTGLVRALTDCELNASERVAAELFDGERSLADLTLAMAGLPGVSLSEAGLYALAWGLIALGAVRPVEPGDEAPIDVAGLGVRAMATLVAPQTPAKERRRGEREMERPADRAIDRDRLLAKRAQINDCDYYAVLGVDRDASDHEIRRAYDRLRADFSRERFGDPVKSELGEALDEIHEVLDEAYRVLMDGTLRSSYRSHLQE